MKRLHWTRYRYDWVHKRERYYGRLAGTVDNIMGIYGEKGKYRLQFFLRPLAEQVTYLFDSLDAAQRCAEVVYNLEK